MGNTLQNSKAISVGAPRPVWGLSSEPKQEVNPITQGKTQISLNSKDYPKLCAKVSPCPFIDCSFPVPLLLFTYS